MPGCVRRFSDHGETSEQRWAHGINRRPDPGLSASDKCSGPARASRHRRAPNSGASLLWEVHTRAGFVLLVATSAKLLNVSYALGDLRAKTPFLPANFEMRKLGQSFISDFLLGICRLRFQISDLRSPDLRSQSPQAVLAPLIAAPKNAFAQLSVVNGGGRGQ